MESRFSSSLIVHVFELNTRVYLIQLGLVHEASERRTNNGLLLGLMLAEFSLRLHANHVPLVTASSAHTQVGHFLKD